MWGSLNAGSRLKSRPLHARLCAQPWRQTCSASGTRCSSYVSNYKVTLLQVNASAASVAVEAVSDRIMKHVVM